MADIIIILILAVIIFAAVRSIYRAKKSGAACMSCSSSGVCGKKNCTCSTEKTKKADPLVEQVVRKRDFRL